MTLPGDPEDLALYLARKEASVARYKSRESQFRQDRDAEPNPNRRAVLDSEIATHLRHIQAVEADIADLRRRLDPDSPGRRR